MTVDVIGMGPGSIEYLLPMGLKKIKEADVLIGGQRNLKDLDILGKKVLFIENNLKDITDYIQLNSKREKIALVVSGDPGFHSMLAFLKKNTKDINILVTPGISSFTYFFSKLSMSWEDAVLTSVHGEKVDYIEILRKNKKVGFLTDAKVNSKVIAQNMIESGFTKAHIYIGENLSYTNEKITKLTVEQATKYNPKNLSVVVIIHE